MDILKNENTIFPRGEKANADYFTGTAWLNVLVPTDETGTYAVNNVAFEPGGKTNWHTHGAGQILLVTSGKGFYQEKGKPAQLLHKGDVVVIPSNIKHWHGATRNSSFSHIAITNIGKNGPVEWLEPVSDEEYQLCHEV